MDLKIIRTILDVVHNAVYYAILFHLYKTIYAKNTRFNKYYKLAFAMGFAFATIQLFLNLPYTAIVILNVIPLFALSALFKGQWPKKLVVPLFLAAMGLLSEQLVNTALSILNYRNSEPYLVLFISSKIIELVLIMIMCHLIPNTDEYKLPLSHWIAVFITPVFSFILANQLISIYEIHLTHSILYVMLFFLFFNLFIIYIFGKTMKDFSQIKNDSLKSQQVDYYMSQLNQLQVYNNSFSDFKHSYKNRLLGLRADIEEGNIEKTKSEIDLMLGYLGEDPVSGPAQSGNIVIDSIVNIKAIEAKGKEIEFEADINVSETISIESRHLSIAIGNAIDNAIEACMKLNPEERYIQVKMSMRYQQLLIGIRNPYDGLIYTNSKGDIITSKFDKQAHGIGLSQIKDIVSIYNGLYNERYDGKEFYLTLALTLKESI